MRPIFTIHAGEMLVADQIERVLKLPVWVPSKDTGVDLLVTDRKNKKAVSLQVKFSKDFSYVKNMLKYKDWVQACGWWVINRRKLLNSKAQIWIFVLYPIKKVKPFFVIIKKTELIKLYKSLGQRKPMIQTYIWVVENNKSNVAIETRGLKSDQIEKYRMSDKLDPKRVLTKYLNNWDSIKM